MFQSALFKRVSGGYNFIIFVKSSLHKTTDNCNCHLICIRNVNPIYYNVKVDSGSVQFLKFPNIHPTVFWLQLLTYGRRIPFAELFARIDAVDASTIKRVANRFIYDRVKKINLHSSNVILIDKISASV